MTSITLREIADLVGGELIATEQGGNADKLISGASTIRDVCSGEITLADNPELEKRLNQSSASAVITDGTITVQIPAIVVANVHEAFGKIVSFFRPMKNFRNGKISSQANVAATAKIAEGATVHPGAVIGENVELADGVIVHSNAVVMDGSKIGSDSEIFPNAVLYQDTIVGKRCLIHSGAVLGAYGFGYDSSNGKHKLSSQLGFVQLENDVEVGANSSIDRGTYDATRIGEGTKIDNQVMIAHNCSIGRHNLICSLVGIAGSCSTGDYVVMAGQVGVADHINIGDHISFGAKTGVIRDIKEKGVYFGMPCYLYREKMKQLSGVKRLPETVKVIKRMQADVARLLAKEANADEAAESLVEPKSKSSAA